MTQTLALLLDAYRELNARKLFWITLMLSGLVVVSFALVGINENGLHVLFWDLRIPGLSTEFMSVKTFYKLLFTQFGIGFWLTWIAAVLALVSTAGIFPDFVSAGSIDLVLSKPIGRLRLFLTKYFSGLLFVALQVSVFSVASLLVMGIKGGVWLPSILLAIPVVTIFFSYLFCICTLVGLVTRSTIAALLLTILAWFLIFAVHATESVMLSVKLVNEQEIKALDKRIQRNEAAIDRLKQRGSEIDFNAASAGIQQLLDQDRKERGDSEHTAKNLAFAHGIAMNVKTALPKTAETIELLKRWMVDASEMPRAPGMPENGQPGSAGSGPVRHRGGPNGVDVDVTELAQDTEAELRSRSVWWVMGTSLVFEASVLAIAAFIFCRRDF